MIVPEDDVLPLINNGDLRLLDTKKINPKSYLLKQDNKLNKKQESEEEHPLYPLEQCNAQ